MHGISISNAEIRKILSERGFLPRERGKLWRKFSDEEIKEIFQNGLPKIVGWKPVLPVDKNRAQKQYDTAGQRKIYTLMQRDGACCFYCKCQIYLRRDEKEPHATLDHYIPKSKGGTGSNGNLVLACPPCNNIKKDLMPNEFKKKVSIKMKKVTFYLPERDLNKLKTIARKAKDPVSEVVRQIVKAHLK